MGRCDFENFNILIYITKLIKLKKRVSSKRDFSFPNERSRPFCASADRASYLSDLESDDENSVDNPVKVKTAKACIEKVKINKN